MNCWIRKEVRLLLPGFIAAMLPILVAWIVPTDYALIDLDSRVPLSIPLLFCPIIALLMALNSFGGEIGADTFSNLLTQPISRKKIFWTKTSILAVFIGTLWSAWWGTFWIRLPNQPLDPSLLPLTITASSILLAVLIFSGSLWTVLAFRQISAAFWISVATPCVLAIVTTHWIGEGDPALPEILAAVFLLYSVLGFGLAYWLFIGAQDNRSSNELSLLHPISDQLSKIVLWRIPRRRRGNLWALASKEARLHGGLSVLAFVLFLGHLGMIAWRLWGGGIERNPTVEMVINGYWVFWLMCPLLIGCTLFAEERRLGVWESQRCLPVPTVRLLLVKGGVGAGLSLILGACVPLVLEANNILPSLRFDFSKIIADPRELIQQGGLSKFFVFLANLVASLPFDPQPLIILGSIALGIFLISSYSSSCSRSVLQSLTAAIGGLFSIAFLSAVLQMTPTFHGLLAPMVLVPLVVASLLCLILRNVQYVAVGASLWWRNAMTLVVIWLGGATVTAMVYYRVWERFTPIEPPHAAGVLRVQDRLQIVGTRGFEVSTFALTSADGRAWSADVRWTEMNAWNWTFGGFRVESLVEPIRQRRGTNWARVVPCVFETVAIQKDGSLWVAENASRKRNSTDRGGSPPPEPLRYGKDQDWSQAVRFHSGALLLKRNGTLWAWEHRRTLPQIQNSSLVESPPSQISPDSDWAELRESPWGASIYLRKKDGRVWTDIFSHHNEEITLKNYDPFSRAAEFDAGYQKKYATVLSSRSFLPLFVALGTNGVLEVSTFAYAAGRRFPITEARTFPLPDNCATGWMDICSDGGNLVSLGSDGTLWKWNFPEYPITSLKSPRVTRLGTHSDWVALARIQDQILTLAADGSVWAWCFDPVHHYQAHTLLAASARPRFLGNILAKTE